MHWLIDFRKEVKSATDEQLKLWLKYMAFFKDEENTNITMDKLKRKKYRELIFEEMKKRGIRRERSRERGKAKKETV